MSNEVGPQEVVRSDPDSATTTIRRKRTVMLLIGFFLDLDMVMVDHTSLPLDRLS